MVSPLILRLLGFVLLQFIGCNNQLSQSKQSIETNASKVSTEVPNEQPCGSDQVWDMISEKCVDVCKTDDCCNDISCPEGTVCVEGLGVCGVAIGDDLYELGYGWWTGKSTNLSISEGITERPVVFSIVNSSRETVYLKANYRQQPMVEISTAENSQKLTIPENYFCPLWCPEDGMPMELDCGRPRDQVIALAAGQTVESQWSGLEVYDVVRYSAEKGRKTCQQNGQTLNGSYTIEVCVYKVYEPADPNQKDEGKLLLGRVKGNSLCITTSLQFPSQSSIEVVLE